MENTQKYSLNTEKASAFYNGLKDKGRVKQEGLNAFLENAKDPEYAKRFYNALSQKGYVKQDGIESFMSALYGSAPKGVPYADAPARSSMTDQFGVFDKAAEADAENRRKAAQHIEELQRAQKEAQKPRIMTPEEVNEMAAQPLLQDKGIDLFGQKEKQAQRTQDMLNVQQAPEKALSSINRNIEALDVLKARLEEVENDLKGENKAGTQYNEEMRSLLTENIKRLTEDTRKQQTDYFDKKISELNDLYGAAHLKRGYNLINSTEERMKHLQGIAENMPDEVADDIVRNRSLMTDALKNMLRAKRKASLDNDASGWSKFWAGIATGFDGGAGLTLGLSDLSEALHAKAALRRMQEGKGTTTDRMLINSLLDKMGAEELYEPGTAGQIGQGVYDSLEFMLDMAITGGVGGATIKGVKVAGKAIAKKAGKKIAKEVTETAAKSATKQFAQRIGQDLAASAVGSMVSPMMYNEALRRQNENYLFGRDENGEVTVKETADPESLAESFAQALLSNNISRLVERGVGPVMEKGLQAIAKPLAKITPEWLKFGNNFLSNLGRNVKDLMSVQGFLPEFGEEFVEELLTRALVEQTSREKELGVGKWDDLFSPEWCKVTAGSVAVIQAAMGLPGFSASTANAAGNSARMRKRMRNLPDNLREEVGRIARMEDDNQRAQALSSLLKRSTDLQRRDILGYLTARAANNLGVSFSRAEAQQQESENYRQTLLAATMDGQNLYIASDKSGNLFAFKPTDNQDPWSIGFPLEGSVEDGTLKIGKPRQIDAGSLDMDSVQEYSMEDLLGALSKRQEQQNEAQDSAIGQQEQQAAGPDADADKVYVAGHEFNYTDPKGNIKTVPRGSRIVPIETVPSDADPNTVVQVAITKPGSATSAPGVMPLSEFQDMLEQGYMTAEEHTDTDTAGDVQTDEEGNPLPKEEAPIQQEAQTEVESGTEPQEVVPPTQQPAAPEDNGTEKNSGNGIIGRGATEEEAADLIARMEANAEASPEVELTPENWTAQFGENGEVETPIGTVKMGENQLAKMFLRKRDKEFGMIFPTLTDPDLIIEEESSAKDGSEERPSSYLFVKTFLRDGKKVKHYASVTVQKEGMEVVVSNHYLEESALKGKLQNGKVLYTKEALLSNSSDGHLAEHQNGVPDLLPTQENNASSENKGTEVSEEKQEVRLPENPVAVMYESLLSENEGNEAEAVDTANQMVANKTSELEQARKSQTKGKTIEAIQAAKRAKREKVAALETEVKFWKDVAAYPEAKRQAEETARKLQKRIDAQQRAEQARRNNPQRLRLMDRDKALGEPLSLEEYVLRRIATGATKFLWDGTSQGTGGLREHGGGKRYMLQFVDKNTGKVPEVVADDMEQDIRDNHPEFGNVTASEILDVIEGIGVGEQSFSYLMARAEELHNRNDYDAQAQEEAEEAAREERAREEAAADIAQASVEYMSDEEYEALSRPEFVGEMFNTDGTPKRVARKKQAKEVEKQPSETERAIASAEAQTETNPTEKQKEAGNYRKGHVKVNSFDLTIENPKGSERSGVDGTGRAWRQTMHNTYGYIRGTEGVDGDHIDVFLSDTPETGDVFVIDQVNPKTGAFDEHKVMMGFDSEEAAREAYLSNYAEGWQGIGNISRVSQEEFKKWVNSSHRKTKPFAEYKGVSVAENVDEYVGDKIRRERISKGVMTEEEYLASMGYPFMGYSEPALHKGRQKTARAQEKIVKDYANSAKEYDEKRAELKKEYREKVERGELRAPTIAEETIEQANGNPESAATQAARRSAEKRGIDWRVSDGDEEVRMRRGEPRQDNALSEEERGIVERAKADGTYLKSPNGKPTKLSPKQWAQVRTKAFKDWFGDWEKAARIEKLRDSKPIEITGNEIVASDDLNQYKKNALNYGKTLRGEYTNKDTGNKVNVSATSLKEVLRHDGGDIAHIQSVAAIPAIIENGIYIDTVTNEDAEKNPNVREYQYYVTGLMIGGVDYTVKSVVAIDRDGNRYYDHALTQIEKGNLLNEVDRITSPSRQEANSLSDIKDKRLLSILQTDASKVVDGNGEPLVVYHGTPNKFTIFDASHIGETSGDRGLFGAGFYFNPSSTYVKNVFAAGVNGNVMPVFLNIRNPYVVEDHDIHELSKFLGGISEKDIDLFKRYDPTTQIKVLSAKKEDILTENLKKAGYDGVKTKDYDPAQLVAFSPTQIKSATDNVGAFDAENPDIRFRFVGEMFDADGKPKRIGDTDVQDNIYAFAEKYGFDVADVQQYADSMRMENSVGANRAFIDMKRKVRIDNTDKSLGEFVKIFAPIKAELYEKFGDVDALNEKYRQRALDERNVMEAARKRVEEEAQAERKRLAEFEVMSDAQLDKAYLKAIEDKDEARMRDLVNEAARRNGYVPWSEFRMAHRAPSYDETGYVKSMVDVANNRDQIRESLNEQFQMNRDRSREESVAAIEQALAAIDRGENPTVTIYRAVPKSLKEGRVRNGDWVTLSENYAKKHGNYVLEGDYRIMKEVVPAENLYWDGNDINEWGYDDRSDYRYRDTKNNRKLNDLITRDDAGNIIPLSQRFNARKNDARYRFTGEKGTAAKTSLEARRQAALDAGAALGVPIVVEETPAGGRRRAKDDALGWYDTRTGAVHVNPGNHADAEDVQRTVLHEAVGHMGMRRLLERKAPGTYDTFLDRVYASMPAEARAYFEDYARRSQAGRDLSEAELSRIAADEYVAALAEVGTDPSTWQKVVALVREALRAIGFNLSLSDADIRALLYESKHNLESAAYAAQRDMFRQRQEEFRAAAELDRRIEEDTEDDITKTNERFNEQLESLTDENADSTILSLGSPNEVLLSAGISDKPMKLYGNKITAKARKHGFTISALKNLPEAVAAPIAVFDNLGRKGNRSILTELYTEQGNFLVTVDWGKDADIDFNIVSSVFGKGGDNIVDWINRGLASYIDKGKALRFLSHQSAPIAAAAANQGLSNATKIVQDFENPKVLENVRLRRNLSGTEYDKRLGIIGLTPEGATKRQKMHNFATLWGKRLLDSSLPVKNLTNHLKQTNGGRVYSDTDLWSLKTTIPSKVMHGIDRFKKNIGNPLSNTLRDIYRATREQHEELGIPAKKKNGTYYIGMYLMAKHMPERNAWMLADRMLGKTIEDIAQKIFNRTGGRGAMSDKDMNELRRNVLTRFGRNYIKAFSKSSIQELTEQIHGLIEKRNQERFDKEKARAEKKGIEAPVNSMHPLTDEDMGKIAEKAYPKIKERFKKLTDEDKDFAGKTAFIKRFGMKPKEYVKMFEAMMRKNGLEGELDKMWEYINQATEFSLRERLESGLLSKEAYNNIMARGWKNYVPLRSWDERNEESADYFEIEYPERIDNNSTVFTNPTIKAKGRKSLADNPLPYIFRDAETAIRKGEENRFFQAVAKLRDDNANFTYIFGNAAFLEGKETSTEKNSHLVPYYNNGVKTNVVFVNPQLAAALRGDTESAFGKVWRSAALNWIPPVTRFMSAMLTSMNPAFATLNLMRDLGLATLSRFVEAPDPLRGTWDAALFLYEWFKNMPAAIKASAKPDSIYTNNGRNAQLIRAWKENGGETGWHTLNDLRDTKDKLYKEITKSGVQKSLKNVAAAIPTAFRFFTEVSENSVRLAAFADAKRRGLDDQAAAFYSKEITTNFNRHSNLSSAVNPLFMFFNASTQGINRILQLAKENPGNFSVAAVGMMMAGFVGAIANAAGGGDDDDYLHRSFYVRANNLVIGKWTIPLAHGFRMFYGLGAAYADYIMGNASEAEMFYNMFGLVGNELMPGPLNLTDITAYNSVEDRINWIVQEGVGNYMRNLVPSSVLPFYDIYRNRDFMGGTISQEPFAGTESKYMPRVARSKKNVNPWLEALNYHWAGLWGFDPELDSEIAWDDQKGRPTRYPAVSASDIEYIIGQYAGGTGEFVNDMVKLGTKIVGGEDFTKADVPVLKKLYRPTDPENAILSDYYTIKEYADVLQRKIDESLKQAKTDPNLSARARRKAVNRIKDLSVRQAESQLKAFGKYQEKVAELYKLQRKGVSEDILKPKRIWLMKEANNLKEGMLRELEPKQGERYARIMKIKDNDLRGLAAFWDFIKETYGGKAANE
ncbi:MAG: hypothetical protein K2L50_00565 [Bacteroidales bacterium]|nr:hypothetical protein [Bacteroidales bacterium]